jgi:LysM repeat protein
MLLRWIFPVLFACLFAEGLFSPPAFARETVHVVYPGQRLGSIARRYNVTVEALCRRNGIRETAPIRPGQRLIIPEVGGKGRSDAAESSAARTEPSQAEVKKPAPDPNAGARAQVHVVQRGHTLTDISRRYGVTIGAICRASGLDRDEPLDVGQVIIVPDKADADGEQTRRLRLAGYFERDGKGGGAGVSNSRTYLKYLKRPWRKGYVKLFRYKLSWHGYVVGARGELLGQASSKINWLLGAESDGPRIDPRLIRLLAQVSDAFGGREVRVVSGYRTQSWVNASKHKDGRALDFSILGVPNEALRDYLRTLPDVGVGYYPNSSFVHLDVRPGGAYWVDYAGPGEPPRKHP